MPNDADLTQGTPLRREPGLVKTQPNELQQMPGPRDFRRHLQGYELGLVTLGMVFTFALLALPRASRPETLPLPRASRILSERYETTEGELAAAAEKHGLPFEVRAVGEAIRHFGLMNEKSEDSLEDRAAIKQRVRVALEHRDSQALLELRAVQTEYFIHAFEEFSRAGVVTPDLAELGGDFVQQAQRSGWLDGSRHFRSDTLTMRTLFRVRWSELSGLHGVFPFTTSLNESRSYYRFLLLHPARLSDRAAAAEDDAARLKLVAALTHVDPEYPASFAQGYLLFRMGDLQSAAAAYRRQLGRNESGAYALLARNYLIFALQGVGSE